MYQDWTFLSRRFTGWSGDPTPFSLPNTEWLVNSRQRFSRATSSQKASKPTRRPARQSRSQRISICVLLPQPSIPEKLTSIGLACRARWRRIAEVRSRIDGIDPLSGCPAACWDWHWRELQPFPEQPPPQGWRQLLSRPSARVSVLPVRWRLRKDWTQPRPRLPASPRPQCRQASGWG